MTVQPKGNEPPIPHCLKCNADLPQHWREWFCSVECYMDRGASD